MDRVIYKSTRGNKEYVTSSKAILQGISPDGGLYVPTTVPWINISDEKFINMDYCELAFAMMRNYLSDFSDEEISECIRKAYDNKFDTDKIAPITNIGGDYFLELYHGATLAFKDMALSILPHLLKMSAEKLNINKEIVILTATSGDTGKAALEAFANVNGIKIIVFYPENGVSEIQKRQMVTQTGKNVYVIGIDGNFGDAQSSVKDMFNDRQFSKIISENGYMFSSANSINIGRLIPQIVYYFYGYYQIVKANGIKLGDEINVAVPTGNFGNILAAYYSKLMGLPIKGLICASNENKILTDFINTGIYDKNREFFKTISPSMDILISSNLERLLYLLSDENSDLIKELMGDLNTAGRFNIKESLIDKLKCFYADYSTEDEIRDSVRKVFSREKYLIDTHTAVAYSVYEKYKAESGDNTKTMIVSTASPYKFTRDVMTSINRKYLEYDDFELLCEMASINNDEVPIQIRDIDRKPIIHTRVCNRDKMRDEVSEILNINRG